MRFLELSNLTEWSESAPAASYMFDRSGYAVVPISGVSPDSIELELYDFSVSWYNSNFLVACYTVIEDQDQRIFDAVDWTVPYYQTTESGVVRLSLEYPARRPTAGSNFFITHIVRAYNGTAFPLSLTFSQRGSAIWRNWRESGGGYSFP